MKKAADYSQRGIVTVLVGVTVWGIYAIWDVHTQIMAKAQGAFDRVLRLGYGMPD